MSERFKLGIARFTILFAAITWIWMVYDIGHRIGIVERRLQAVEAEQVKTLKDLNRMADLLLKTQLQLGITTGFVATNLIITNWTAKPITP